MKKANITSLLICLTFSLLFFNCKSDDDINPVTINADTYPSLNDLVQALKPNVQSFTIDPTTNQTVTGTDGTIVNINQNAFTDDEGNLISSAITVNLREHLTLEDMLLANAQTSSNNQILITGGSFNLTFEDENGASVIANPWSIACQMPVQTEITGYENQMQYYIGEYDMVDGREMVNWEFAGDNNEAWMDEDTFNIFGIEQGLSNCDVLYNMNGDTPTQFEVTISDVTDYTSTTVWMVIDDFPSVIMITSINTAMTALKAYDNSIPTGLNATLIAMTVDADNYLKFGSLPITVLGDDIFNIAVDYGTTEELTTLIQNIAN
ncbi:hypothetical protein [Winogradskyella sp. Asnod2-B02-A]|uniref:hypothetical protein n=1 Tax=Winogradskyella sp. Asnod2-B02-A TaxID=3160583 RepID=UPI003864CE6A